MLFLKQNTEIHVLKLAGRKSHLVLVGSSSLKTGIYRDFFNCRGVHVSAYVGQGLYLETRSRRQSPFLISAFSAQAKLGAKAAGKALIW